MRKFKLLLSVVLVAGLAACTPETIEPLSEVKTVSGSTFSMGNGEDQNILTGENRPLIVLDGKIVNNDTLESLDPNDIESIHVLKGKSATSLYGEKAENGVIMITLKS